MPTDLPAPEIIVWTDDLRASLVERVIELMASAVTVIGIGGPREPGVDALAGKLGIDRHDDLRKLIVDRPAAYLLMATGQEVHTADLISAAKQGTTILAMEPVAEDLQALGELSAPPGGRANATSVRIVHLPAFAQSPGYLQAADPFDVLGERRMVVVENHGPREEASLFARLLDAWRIALKLIVLPDSIDASLIGPGDRVPESLRWIAGRMAVHARCPDGSSLVMTISDGSGAARRSLTVLGDEAELGVTNTSYHLRYIDGREVDHGEDAGQPDSTADLIVHQWRRVLDGRNNLPEDRVAAEAEALACGLACLLSTRTGQSENPAKLIQINR